MNRPDEIAARTAEVLAEGNGFSPPINCPWAMSRLLIDDVLNKYHILVYSWIKHKETGEYASCSVTNATFAKHLKVSERYVSSIINDLIAADLVRVKYVPGTTHKIRTLCTEANRIYWDKLRAFRPGTGSSTTPFVPELGVLPPPELGVLPNKNTLKTTKIQTSSTSPSAPAAGDGVPESSKKSEKTSKESSVFDLGEEKEKSKLDAKRLAEAFMTVATKHKLTAKLNAQQLDGAAWVRTFQKAIKSGISADELMQDIQKYDQYRAAGGLVLASTPAKFLEKRQDIENSIQVRAAMAKNKGVAASPIDEKLRAKVESAYSDYCRVNGTPNWKPGTESEVLGMLTQSVAAFKEFRRESLERYDKAADIVNAGKPATVGSEERVRWNDAHHYCKTYDSILVFDANLHGFMEWWLRCVKKELKAWTPSMRYLTWKPDSKVFRENCIKEYAPNPATFDRIMTGPKQTPETSDE